MQDSILTSVERTGIDGAAGRRAALIYTLLFLFPVGNFVVPHWLSTSFVVLAIAALFGPWCSWSGLRGSERWLLLFAVAYFAAFLLSGWVNGAQEALIKRLGVELRYLFIVPLYLVVRNLPHAAQWLLRGCALGGMVFAANAGYEYFVAGHSVVAGAYHHILYGTVAAVYGLLLWNHWWAGRETGFWQWLYLFGALAAALTVALSGSRTAYVVLVVLAMVWGALRLRGPNLVLALVVVACAALGSYAISDRVANRVQQAVDDIAYYASLENPADMESGLPSFSLRLEMWRASLLIIRDHPWVGVSREGYEESAAKYVDQGKVHWQAPTHGQPHNAYLEVLVSLGLIGFLPFAGMLLVPTVAVFARARTSDSACIATLLLITGYAVASLAASAPFYRGNAVSVFVVFLAVLMADCMRAATLPGPDR